MADRRLPVNTASRRRLLVLYVVAAAMLISLGGRLWYLQVMNNTAFTKLAAANQTRDVIVPAVRGQILDDVGNRLVTNQTALVVSVDMMDLSQQPGGAAPVLRRLAPLLGMSDKLLAEKTRLCTKGVSQPCWAGSPYQPIPVDQNVSDQVALQVMEEQKEFPGVTAQVQPVVDYPEPDGANPAQVLGYLQPITPQEIKSRHLPVTGFSGVDLVGQAGLEAQYDSQLRGSRAPRWCRSTPPGTSPAPSARPARQRRRPGDQPQRADPGRRPARSPARSPGPGRRATTPTRARRS
jgi:penicillin-binding protein 2